MSPSGYNTFQAFFWPTFVWQMSIVFISLSERIKLRRFCLLQKYKNDNVCSTWEWHLRFYGNMAYSCELSIIVYFSSFVILQFQNTTNEIMTLWFETLYHLFNQLHYDLPLPQCLQVSLLFSTRLLCVGIYHRTHHKYFFPAKKFAS